jgi:hypothetical protein
MLPYRNAGGGAFVPRPRGFGARLLGLDPDAVRRSAGDAIVAARQERDLLRPDLTLLAADGRLLPDALAPGPTADDGWAAVELPDPADAPALRAVLDAVAALAPEGPVGVLLAGPGRLAAQVAGGDEAGGADEELLDACALVACDAAKAVLAAGGHVVLEQDRAPTEDELALWSPLLRLLSHHRRPALVVLDDAPDAGSLIGRDGVGAVACGSAAPAWGAPWPRTAREAAFAPRIDAEASPERVQELVRTGAPA